MTPMGRESMPPRSAFRKLAAYLAAVALCLACLTWLTRLWKLDLSIPFSYSRDALIVQLWVHSVHETGWYLHNDRVGMPLGSDMHDFPLFDSAHFLLIKILSCFTSNPFVTCNLFFLLTFPLTTATALLVFRQFGCSYATSLVGSLLFTFLPYHYLRGTAHLFLASYYHVPLMVMVMLWIYQGDSFLTPPSAEGRPWWRRLRGKALATQVIGFVVGCGGIYYAFFSCVLLACLGLTVAIKQRSGRPAAAAAGVIALVVVASLANLFPYIVYRAQHGPNPEPMARQPAEAEIYGLRIAQLLLPVTRHQLSWLAKLKDRYNRQALSVNENDAATLGLVASIGFLLLLGRLLRTPKRKKSDPLNSKGSDPFLLGVLRKRRAESTLWEGLSLLNFFALLLALRGGFSGLIALPFAWIRGYNRVSVLLGFFALFAVVLGLDALRRRYARSPRANTVYLGFLGLLLAVGLMDQTPRASITPTDRVRPAFEHDAAFIRQIEASAPAHAMIFQLPFAAFPEQGAIKDMGDYELLRAYLHSRTLRWSHGAMRGRQSACWQRTVAGLHPENMIPSLTGAGFEGIYIDRFGFDDRAAGLEKSLRRLLPTSPLVSANGRLAYFSLKDYIPLLPSERGASAP